MSSRLYLAYISPTSPVYLPQARLRELSREIEHNLDSKHNHLLYQVAPETNPNSNPNPDPNPNPNPKPPLPPPGQCLTLTLTLTLILPVPHRALLPRARAPRPHRLPRRWGGDL